MHLPSISDSRLNPKSELPSLALCHLHCIKFWSSLLHKLVEKEEYAHSRQSTVTSPFRTTTCNILWSSVKRKRISNFLYLDSITVLTASYPNPLDWSKEHTSAGNTVVGSQRSSKLDGHSQTARIRRRHWGFQSIPAWKARCLYWSQTTLNTKHHEVFRLKGTVLPIPCCGNSFQPNTEAD